MSLIEITPLVVLTIILTVAVITDIRFHKIPNWLTLPSMLFGICYMSITGSHGVAYSMAGLLLGLCIFMPFYLVAGMGAGDVKLLGVVGVFLGPGGVFVAFLATAIIGGIYAIILLKLHGLLKETIIRYRVMLITFIYTQRLSYIPPEKGEKKPVLVYGVAIAIGSTLTALKGFI